MVRNVATFKPEALVKKRKNQWENETYETLLSPDAFVPACYGDRFIPRRYSLVCMDRNLKFSTQKSVKDILKMRLSASYWRQNYFTSVLKNYIGMNQQEVLKLTDPEITLVSSYQKSRYLLNTKTKFDEFDWPCRPRLKPLAFTDTTHDLPDFDSAFEHNLVDWSVTGQIVVSFGNDVIVWKSKEDVTMVFKIKCPRSLAYSPNGHFLAIGCKACEYPVLELWDVECSKDFFVVSGKVFDKKHSDVQCIEWSKSGKQIVCGTHFGIIYVLSVPDLRTIQKVRKHKLPISILRFSPTMHYLASGDVEGNIVIYNWSSCDVYLYVRSRRKLNVIFDWHPWTGVDLAISEDVPASIVILHVPSKEIVAYYQRKGTQIVINSVTFSKITGELLVSISNQDGGLCNDHKILVLSSLDCIVDMLRVPDGGARFLMWSPDGSRLATTSNDETLTIWNFYPGTDRTNEYIRVKSIYKGKLTLEADYGIQFERWCSLK